jgi:symplekin
MASRDDLHGEAVDLLNEVLTSGEGVKDRLALLAQVQELTLHRDVSLLPDVVPMVLPLQTDRTPSIRKFVLTFLRDVAKQYPQYATALAEAVCFLLADENEGVRRQCVLVASSTFRGTLRWMAQGGGTAKDWASVSKMKDAVVRAIDQEEDISSVAIKFAETVVLAFVPGRGVGPNAAREGDKSLHRELPYTHPFLRAVRLEDEGYQLARRMAQWMKDGGPEGAPDTFSKKHYLVLENALQNVATSKSALFGEMMPPLTGALRNISFSQATAALQATASQLRAACLKLLKVAPAPTAEVQQLLDTIVAGGWGGDRVRQAVDANPSIRGKVRAPFAPELRTAPGRPRHSGLSSAGPGEGYSYVPLDADTLVSIFPNLPPPPPGRSDGISFPYGRGRSVFVYVIDRLAMEGVGTRIAEEVVALPSRKRPRAERSRLAVDEDDEDYDAATGIVGDLQAAAEEAAASASTDSVKWFETSTESGDLFEQDSKAARQLGAADAIIPNSSPDQMAASDLVERPLDPAILQIGQAYKAFSRILKAEEGVRREGGGALHRKLISKLGRMLAEAEASLKVDGDEDAAGELLDARRHRTSRRLITFLLEDYPNRYAVAMDILNEMYAAETAEAAGIQVESKELYNQTLLAIVNGLPHAPAFETRTGARLFASTVVDCPKLPSEALDLVCSMCERADRGEEVFAGLIALRDLAFFRPSARQRCLQEVLQLTGHKDTDVRTKSVQVAANQLWPKASFTKDVEAFAKEALVRVAPLPVEAKRQDPTMPTSWAAALWPTVPDRPDSTRQQLALYFALCVKTDMLLPGLFEAYAAGSQPVQAGISAEMAQLMRVIASPQRYPSAKAAGEAMARVVSLTASAPADAEPLILEVLDLLIPIESNSPSEQVIASLSELRMTRYGYSEEKPDAGLAVMVFALKGLGDEGAQDLLPGILRQATSNKVMVKSALRRMTLPHGDSLYTPVQMLVMLHTINHVALKVSVKCITATIGLCLEERSIFNSKVIKETLDAISSAALGPPPDPSKLPMIFMRTVIVALKSFPDMKTYIARTLLPRLVSAEVWRQPKVWEGFVLCAKAMGTETGATSFIALIKLPVPQLKQVLKAHESLRGPLRAYASTIIKLDPGIKEALK